MSEKYYCPSCNQFFDDRFEAVTFDNRCSDCNAPVVIMANNGGRHIVKIVSELRRSLADKNKEMETMVHVSLYDEMCEMKNKEIERLMGFINVALSKWGEYYGPCGCKGEDGHETAEEFCPLCNGTGFGIEDEYHGKLLTDGIDALVTALESK